MGCPGFQQGNRNEVPNADIQTHSSWCNELILIKLLKNDIYAGNGFRKRAGRGITAQSPHNNLVVSQ